MSGKKQKTRKKIVRKPEVAKLIVSQLEIHRLVAEIVLGWRLHTHRTTAGIFVRNNKPTLDYWQGENGDDVLIADDWSPTTNIADAWRIVEKLQSRYWLDLKSPFEAGEQWQAGFTERGATGWNGKPDFRGAGETAPLAICRAALAIFAGHECFEENQTVEQQ
jgi:hypothetical protein